MNSPLSHSFGGFAAAVTALAKHHVEFVVCGGVASVFHGVPRSTGDLDVLVRLTDENLSRLIDAALELGLQPRIPEPITALKDARRRDDWIKNKHAKVFTLVSPHSPLQIDVFLEYPLSFEEAFADARIAVVDDVRFRICSIEHLIKAKRAVDPPRDTDEFDLKHLERIMQRDQGKR